VRELPQQLHAVSGEKFQITCTATNDRDAPANLMFSWRTPNGVQVSVTVTDEDDSHTASSTLHISTVTHNYAGVYQCVVRNGESQNYEKTTVVVEGDFYAFIVHIDAFPWLICYRTFITTSDIQH